MVATVSGSSLGLLNNVLNQDGSQNDRSQSKPESNSQFGNLGLTRWVNSTTGNLILQRQDQMLVGLGEDLKIARTYNAQGRFNDSNGNNFRFSFNTRIDSVNGRIVRIAGDGSESRFQLKDASYSSDYYVTTDGEGAHDTLVRKYNYWIYKDGDSGLIEVFDSSGRLRSTTDQSGLTTYFEWDNYYNRLDKIHDASEQVVELVYDKYRPENIIAMRTFSDGAMSTTTYYRYDRANRLVKVITDLSPQDNRIDDDDNDRIDAYYQGLRSDHVAITEYDYYDSYELYSNGYYNHAYLIKSVRQSDGTQTRFTYVNGDGQWRVKTVQDGSGHGQRTLRYDYDLAARRTDVTLVKDREYDPAKDRKLITTAGTGFGVTQSLYHDKRGRLVKTVSSANASGQREVQRYQYDRDDNLLQVMGNQGRWVRYSYDTQGNRTQEVNSQGQRIDRLYSADNLLLNEIRYAEFDTDGTAGGQAAEPQVTRFVYDDYRRLRFEVSATGEVNEIQYLGDLPRGESSDLEYLFQTVLDEIRETGYWQDYEQQPWPQVQVQKSISYQSFFELNDLRPENSLDLDTLLAWTASNQSADTAQIALTQSDFRGQVAQVIRFSNSNDNGDGAGEALVTRYQYDQFGLLLAEQQFQSLFDWGDEDVQQALNNLAPIAGAKISQRTFSYDGLMRRQSDTDALGNVTSYLYGGEDEAAAGRFTTRLANGLLINEFYDARGWLLLKSESDAESGAALGATRYFYDAHGREIAILDPNGVLTLSIYNDRGNLIAKINGEGQITRYEYDSRNLLTQKTQLARAVSSEEVEAFIQRDDSGQLLSVNAIDLSMLSLQAEASQDRSEYYYYNEAGQLIFEVDPESGVKEYRYNALGQLISEIEHADLQGRGAVESLLAVGEEAYFATPLNYLQLAEAEEFSLSDIDSMHLDPIFPNESNTQRPSAWQATWIHEGGIYRGQINEAGQWQTLTKVHQAENTEVIKALDQLQILAQADGKTLIFWREKLETRGSYQVHYSLLAADGEVLVDAARLQFDDEKDFYGVYDFQAVTLASGDVALVAEVLPFSRNWRGDKTPYPQSDRDIALYLLNTQKNPPSYVTRFLFPKDSAEFVNEAKMKDGVNLNKVAASADYGSEVKPEIVANKDGGFSISWYQSGFAGFISQRSRDFYYNPLGRFQDGEGETLIAPQLRVSAEIVLPGLGVDLENRGALIQMDNSQYISVGPKSSYEFGAEAEIRWLNTTRNEVLQRATITLPSPEGLKTGFFSHHHNQALWQAVYKSLQIISFDDQSANIFWQVNGKVWVQRFDAMGQAKGDAKVLLFGSFPADEESDNQGIEQFAVTKLAADAWQLQWQEAGQHLAQVFVHIQDYDSRNLAAIEKISALNSANNRKVSTFYNKSGDVVGRVDAAGFLRESVYDGSGLLRQEIAYARPVAPELLESPRFDQMTLDTLRPDADTSDRYTTYFYDQAGQRIAELDSENFLREFRYDGAGNLVMESRYVSRIGESVWGHDTSLNFSTLLAALPNQEKRSRSWDYNAANRISAQRSFDGLLERFYYNVQGQLIREEAGPASPAEQNGEQDIRTHTYQYDIQGNLVRYQNPLMQVRELADTYEYDAMGRLTAKTNALGQREILLYDKTGLLRYLINGLGEVTENQYNGFGEISAIKVYQNRLATDVLFSIQGGLVNTASLAKLSELSGHSITLSRKEYDRKGKVIRELDGENFLTERAYNRFGDVVRVAKMISQASEGQGPRFQVSQYSHDKRGLVLSETKGIDAQTLGIALAGSVIQTQQGFDAFGQLVELQDGNGVWLSRTFDGLGQQVTEAVNGQVRKTFSYDSFGREIARTDALGNRFVSRYEDASLVTVLTSADGVVTRSKRNAFGDVIAVQDGAGNTTHYEYDEAGNLKKTLRADGSESSSEYDVNNNEVLRIDGRGGRTGYRFDAANRLVEIIAAEGELDISTQYRYDSLGNTIEIIEADSRTRFSYDANQREVIRIRDVDGLAIAEHSTYNGLGQKLSSEVRDGAGGLAREEIFHFDALGRLIEERTLGAVDNRVQYQYDAKDNIVKKAFADGRFEVYRYNENNELIGMRNERGQVTGYMRNPEGQITQIRAYSQAVNANSDLSYWPELVESNEDRVTLRSYSADGFLRYEVDGERAVQGWIYDGNGDVIGTLSYAMRLPNTAQGELSVADIESQLIASKDDRLNLSLRDALGREQYQIDGAGYVQSQEFDGAGNMVARWVFDDSVKLSDILGLEDNTASVLEYLQTTPSATIRAALDEALAVEKQQAALKQHRVALSFFDAANRLSAFIDEGSYLEKYEYDGRGNLLSSTRFANAVANPLSWYPQDADATLMPEVERSDFDRSERWQYDGANRVVSAQAENGSITLFRYDALDREIERTEGVDSDEVRGERFTYNNVDEVVRQETSHTDLYDGKMEKHYDVYGRLILEIDSEQNETRYTYNELGQKAFILRIIPHLVEGNWQQLAEVEAWTYNVFGEVESTRLYADRLDWSELAGLDASLHHAAVVSHLTISDKDTVEGRRYDANGRQVEQIDGNGNPTEFSLNAFGEIAAIKRSRREAIDIIDQWLFDRRGETLAQWRQLNASGEQSQNLVQERQINAFGELVAETNSLGHTTRKAFDQLGRLIQVSDPSNYVQVKSYDAFGQVISEVDRDGNITHYRYELSESFSNKRIIQTLANGLTVTRELNTFGDTLRLIETDGTESVYRYDRAGNLLTQRDAVGTVDEAITVSQFDKLNRLVSLTENGIETRYQYDAKSRVLTRTIDPDGIAATTRFVYDSKDNVIVEESQQGLVIERRYDAANNVIEIARKMTDRTLLEAFTYDGLNQQASVKEGEMDHASGVIQWQREKRFQYNADNLQIEAVSRMLDETATLAGGSLANQAPLYDLRMRYDTEGNLVESLDVRGNATHYFYNEVGNLAYRVDPEGFVTHFQYNGEGQLTLKQRYTQAIDKSSLSDYQTLHAQMAQVTEARQEFTVYDEMQRELYQVNGVGHVVKSLYDGAGNLTTLIQFARAIDLASLTQQNGNESHRRSVLDSFTQVLANEDRVIRYVYNRLGQQTFKIDPMGYVTEFRLTQGDLSSGVSYYRSPLAFQETPSDSEMRALLGLVPPSVIGENTVDDFITQVPQAYRIVDGARDTQLLREALNADVRLESQRLFLRAPTQAYALIDSEVQTAIVDASSRIQLHSRNDSDLGNSNIAFENYVLAEDYPSTALPGEMPDLGPEFNAEKNGIAVNLLSEQFINTYREHPVFNRLQAYADQKTVLFAAVFDNAGNYLHTVTTPLGQAVQPLKVLEEPVLDENGEPVLDENGEAIIETSIVPDGDPVWKVVENWNYSVNIANAANPLDEGSYQVKYYIADDLPDASDPLAHIPGDVIEESVNIGVQQALPTELSWLAESLPSGTNEIEFQYQSVNDEAEAKVIRFSIADYLAIGDDGRAYFRLSLPELASIGSNGDYEYAIRYLDVNDNQLRLIVGEFNSSLGSDSTRASELSSYRFDYAPNQNHSMLAGLIPDSDRGAVASVRVDVDAYELDNQGQRIVDENGQALLRSVARNVVTHANEERFVKGEFLGNVHLSESELLADGQYQIRYTINYWDGRPASTDILDNYEIGLQADEYQVLSWPAFDGDLAGAEASLRYWDAESDNSEMAKQAEIQMIDGRPSIIFASDDVGHYDFELVFKDDLGFSKAEASGQLQLGETPVLTLTNFDKIRIDNQPIGGSRLVGFIEAAKARTTEFVDVEVRTQSQGDIVASARTVIDSQALLAGEFDGDLNLSIGEPLADGDYLITINYVAMDGSQTQEQLQYTVGENVERDVALTRFAIDALPTAPNSFMVVELAPKGSQDFSPLALEIEGDQWQVMSKTLASGEYDLRFSQKSSKTGMLLARYEATLSVDGEQQSVISWNQAPLQQGQKRSYLRYDAAGRVRFAVTDFDDQGAGYIKEIRYLPSVNGMVMETRFYQEPVLLDETITTSELESLVVDLNLIKHTRAETDANGNYTTISEFMADDAGKSYVLSSENVYDALGNLTASRDLNGNWEYHQYDSIGRKLASFTTVGTPIEASSEFYEQRLAYGDKAQGYYTQYRYQGNQQTETLYLEAAPFNGSWLLPESVLLGESKITVKSYDHADRLREVSIQNAAGETLSSEAFAFDAFGNQVSHIKGYGQPLATETRYRFDHNDQRIEKITGFGVPGLESRTTYHYDNFGQVRETQDSRGFSKHVIFDENSVAIEQVNESGHSAYTVTDGQGNVRKRVDEKGNTTLYYYSAQNTLRYIVEGNGKVSEYRYDVLTSISDYIVYEQSISLAIDELTSLDTIADWLATNRSEGDRHTHYVNDSKGRVLKTIENYDPNRPVENQAYQGKTYDALGNILSVRDEQGLTTHYLYDAASRLLGEKVVLANADGEGQNVYYRRYVYDAMGNLLAKGKAEPLADAIVTGSEKQALQDGDLEQLYQYDSAGNKVFEAGLGGQSAGLVYDLRGNVIEQRDGNGHRSYFFYNARNERVLVIDPNGFATLSLRDSEGNLTLRRSFTDALSSNLYQDSGRSALTTEALNALRKESYATGDNSDSLLLSLGLSQSDYRELVQEYDGQNRLVATRTKAMDLYSVKHGYQNTSIYSQRVYDRSGNLYSEIDGNGVKQFYFYDENNQLVVNVDGNGAVTRLIRDNFGNVTQRIQLAKVFTSNTLQSLTETSDILQLVSAARGAGDRIQEKVFDNYNRLQQEIVYGFEYGEARTESRLIVDYHYLGASKLYHKLERYALNSQDQLLGKTESELFEYDSLGRLTRYQSAAYQDYRGQTVREETQYAYDYWNNQMAEAKVDAAGLIVKQTRTEFVGSRKISERGEAGYVSYQYDENGNVSVIIDEVSESRTVLTRDARNQVTSRAVFNTNASKGSTTTALQINTYAYNAFKQLQTLGTDGFDHTYYAYDTAGRIIETNAGNGVTKLYAYDGAGNNTLELSSQSLSLKGQTLAGLLSRRLAKNTSNLQMRIKAYDNNGQVIENRRFNANNQVADSVTNLLKASNYQNHSLRIAAATYNAFGEQVSTVDSTGGLSEMHYNVLGEVIKKFNPEANLRDGQYRQGRVKTREETYYDAQGRVIATKDGRGLVTRQQWANKQISLVTRADGSKEQFLFDALGDLRQARVLDQQNQSLMTRHYDYQYNHGDGVNGGLQQGERKETTWLVFSGGQYDRTTTVFNSKDQIVRGSKQARDFYNSYNARQGQVTPDQYFRYDALGRLTESKGFDGTIQRIAYQSLAGLNQSSHFSSTANDQGLAAMGGYEQRTRTYQRGSYQYKQEIEVKDHFDRTHLRKNKGNQEFRLAYNQQGQITREFGLRGTSRKDWRFSYDSLGRLITQWDKAVNNRYEWTYDNADRYSQERYYENGQLYRNTQATYNELGQITRLHDAKAGNTINYDYDYAGNRVRVNNHYYSFDSLNRMRIAKGQLNGTQVVRGGGEHITNIDVLGRRRSVQTSGGRLDYSYNGTNGALATVRNVDKNVTLLSQNYYSDGRVKDVVKRNNDNKVTTNKTTRYDQFGSLIFERTHINTDDVKPSDIRYFYDAFGNLQRVETVSYGSDTNTITQKYGYVYFDEAKTRYTHIQGRTSNGKIPNGDWKDGESRYRYDASGNLMRVDRYETGRNAIYSGGRFKDRITFVTDLQDRVLSRQEGSKNNQYYFFAQDNYGNKVNGNKNLDLNYQRVALDKNSINYTVRENDTLRGLAAAFYGDSSLWYVIADANGIQNRVIQAGESLTIPQMSANQNSRSDTFKPYDASKAIGDVAPELPEAPPPRKSCVDILLIILVVIVAVVVTVLISVATAGVASAAAGYASTTLGALAIGAIVGGIGGAIGGFAGSAAAQGVAIGVGLQEEFDWSEVGKSALIGGVAGIFLGGFAGFRAASAAADAARNATYTTTQVFVREFAASFALEFVSESIAQGILLALSDEKPTSGEIGLLFAKAAVKGLVSGVANGSAEALRNVWKAKQAASSATGTATTSIAAGAKGPGIFTRNRETVLQFAQDTFKYGAYYTGAVYGFEAAKAKVRGEEFDSQAAWIKVGMGLIAVKAENKSARILGSRINKVLTPKPQTQGTNAQALPNQVPGNAPANRVSLTQSRRESIQTELRGLNRGGAVVRGRKLELADAGKIRLTPREQARLGNQELARFRQARNAELSRLNRGGQLIRARKAQLAQNGSNLVSPRDAGAVAREVRAFDSRVRFDQRAELSNLSRTNPGNVNQVSQGFNTNVTTVQRGLGFDLKPKFRTQAQSLGGKILTGRELLASKPGERFQILQAAANQGKYNAKFVSKFYPNIVKFGVKGGKVGFLAQLSALKTPAEEAAEQTRKDIEQLASQVRAYNKATDKAKF